MKKEIVVGSSLLAGSLAATTNSSVFLPPMGFNNWARFQTDINESIFVDAANAMASNGLLDAGYNRLNLDDAWSCKERAANGSMQWDPVKFPHGLPWLTQFMKDKGFTPGIYTDAGTTSCGGYPGAYGHEEQDLQTFLDWGFEYLKLDGCNLPSSDEAGYYTVYTTWHELLSNSTSTMILSDSAPAYFSGVDNLTDWYTVMGWASQYGQLARHSADIDTYPNGPAWDSILYNYGQEVRLARYQKVGQFYNDPDFLITDNPTLSLDEKKSQFALWCTMSAPLLLSVNIPALTEEELAILTNKNLIAVDQDTLGQQATLVSRNDTWDVLTRSLSNGDRLLTVLNRGSSVGSITVDLKQIGLEVSTSGSSSSANLVITDLWTGSVSTVNIAVGSIPIYDVPSHGTAVLRISLTQVNSPIYPTGLIFNTASLNCLTDAPSGSSTGEQVNWAACDGSATQTWVIITNGKMHSLANPSLCIETSSNSTVVGDQGACTGQPFSAWSYHSNGNIVAAVSYYCLTESESGVATVVQCGDELDSQVLAMPAGVTVNA